MNQWDVYLYGDKGPVLMIPSILHPVSFLCRTNLGPQFTRGHFWRYLYIDIHQESAIKILYELLSFETWLVRNSPPHSSALECHHFLKTKNHLEGEKKAACWTGPLDPVITRFGTETRALAFPSLIQAELTRDQPLANRDIYTLVKVGRC